MKIILKEFPAANYNQYQFPYCIYAIKESHDVYHDIYAKGFLPYSNDLEMEEEIYYLAKSVRIPLLEHHFNYKQNNILNKLSKKYDESGFCFEIKEKDELINQDYFIAWCLNNAKNDFLSPERLQYILSRPYLKEILEISYQKKTLAYILPIHTYKDFFHVWFSFYDTKIAENDFGKMILLKTISWCKSTGYEYFYIGTCYNLTAFYKLTLSPQAEFFTGNGWSRDVSSLKKILLTSV